MLKRDERIKYEGLRSEYIACQLKERAQKYTEHLIYLQKSLAEQGLLGMKSDVEFVQACYKFFLNREADTDGMVQYCNLLNSGMRREGILFCFAKSPEFGGRFGVCGIAEYEKAFLDYEWDISGVLQYNGKEFIEKCYLNIMGRNVDENGMYSYSKSLAGGMPKEALIYILATSVEAEGKRKIKNLEQYRKAYEGYVKCPSKNKIVHFFRRCFDKLNFSRRNYCEIFASTNSLLLRLDSIESTLKRTEEMYAGIINSLGMLQSQASQQIAQNDWIAQSMFEMSRSANDELGASIELLSKQIERQHREEIDLNNELLQRYNKKAVEKGETVKENVSNSKKEHITRIISEKKELAVGVVTDKDSTKKKERKSVRKQEGKNNKDW